jgi:ferrous iron transport protein B
MASRTIEHERDRRLTIITTSFIPCGAKMPIIALFAGALFGGSGLIAVSAYFIGVAAVIISGIILKKMRSFAGDPAPFVMELPSYHVPSANNVLRSTWERGWSFIRRAGTIILLSSVVLWFLQAFGNTADGFGLVEDNNVSLLAVIGSFIAPVFAPLGFGNWQATVATFTGLIAKENVVSTFGVLYGFAEVAEDGAEIWPQLAAQFTVLTAFSFMVFNLLCAPCFAAIGAIRREMNSRSWTLVAVGYLTVFAYAVSLIVYQIGSLLGGGGFSAGSAAAVIVLGIFAWLLLRKGPLDNSVIRSASQGAKANA